MLQGTDLVILSTVYTLLVFIIGFLVGKRNGTKLDTIVATATTDASTLETRVRALEDATQHLLTTHLAEAKTDTAKAVSAVKQAIASTETEVKKVV